MDLRRTALSMLGSQDRGPDSQQGPVIGANARQAIATSGRTPIRTPTIAGARPGPHRNPDDGGRRVRGCLLGVSIPTYLATAFVSLSPSDAADW